MTLEQFDKLLASYEPVDLAPLMNALRELQDTSIAAGKEAVAAADTYYADASTRKQVIEERITSLTAERDALQLKIDAFEAPLVDAVARQENGRLQDIRGRMRAIEIDKQQIADEIELLKKAFIAGSKELYSDTVEKNRKFFVAKDEYENARGLLCGFATECERDLLKVKEATKTATNSWGFSLDSGLAGQGPDMAKLEEHYFGKR
jgi:chromosome segregation ATPase